jgi:hypothetical protein
MINPNNNENIPDDNVNTAKLWKVIQYISKCYSALVRNCEFNNILLEISNSIAPNRFTVFEETNNINDLCSRNYLYDHYRILFKPTSNLYEMVNWNPNEKPSYEIMMNSVDIANHDISFPAKDIIRREMNKYSPKFINVKGEERYGRLVSILLDSQIFISPDIQNHEFYLIIKL